MAKAGIYKVNSSAMAVNLREGPSTNTNVIKNFTGGTVVRSTGREENGFLEISAPGNGWVSAQYLNNLQSEDLGEDIMNNATNNSPVITGNPNSLSNNVKSSITNDVITPNIPKLSEPIYDLTNQREKDIPKDIKKFLNAFGCPPLFSNATDLPYFVDKGSGPIQSIGRVYASTILSSPSILSISPGKCDHLPNLDKSKRQKFFDTVAKAIDDENVPDSSQLSGKLYEWTSDYYEYGNVVNYLCRTSAIFLGIGGFKVNGFEDTLENLDYTFWSDPESSKASGGNRPSLFKQMMSTITGAAGISDAAYVHFFVTNETDVSESITTSTTASMLEEYVNNSSISGIAKNLEFLFGGGNGSGVMEFNDIAKSDIQKIFSAAPAPIQSFLGLADNYLKGGRMVFPEIIDRVDYSKSLSCTQKYVAPCGDPVAIFLKCLVPINHLLAFALPRQLSGNMYSYPFLLKVYQKGVFNSDLAVMTNLSITRGGDGNSAWTIDNLCTEYNVSFNITPLYSTLMSSSALNPFIALQNDSLMEYLGVYCGVDLSKTMIEEKWNALISGAWNRIMDIPDNTARKLAEYIGTNFNSEIKKIMPFFR